MRVAHLPRGVGVVVARSPTKIITLISEQLTEDEETIGRVIAAFLIEHQTCPVAVAVVRVDEIIGVAERLSVA